MNFSIIEGGAELLGRIEPLWLELRDFHAELRPLWRASLLKVSFEERQRGLLSKCERGLLVLLARIDNQDMAYCVCSIDACAAGEVNSIYVRFAVRRNGIGHALLSKAMDWFALNQVDTIAVDVMTGNDAA